MNILFNIYHRSFCKILFSQVKYFLCFRVFRVFSVQAIPIVRLFIALKCLSIKQTKTNRELRNAAIFASVLIIITTALPVGSLAREMTPVSPLKPPAKFARLSLMNNCKKFKTGSGT